MVEKFSELCLSSKWFYVKTSPVYEEQDGLETTMSILCDIVRWYTLKIYIYTITKFKSVEEIFL